MYLNIFHEHSYDKNDDGFIHIWDDELGYNCIPHEKYAYMLDDNGEYTNIYGKRVKKIYGWSDYDNKSNCLFESDVRPAIRYLIDNYCKDDTPSKNHRELIFDIEVDVTNTFPDVTKALNTITSIALFDKTSSEYTVLLLDASMEMKNEEDVAPDNNKLFVKCFATEHELLAEFIQLYVNINPTIVYGWNSTSFDIPYLYNRLIRVFGREYANMLSPIKKVQYSKHTNKYTIAGVSELDYMRLYKTFTPNERVSYSLDAISMLELGEGKIKYDGSLNDLYRTDKKKFILYNLTDVMLIVKLDKKMKLIELAKGIVHKGKVPLEDIYYASRYLDGAILTYIKNKGFVAINRPVSDDDELSTDDDDDDETFSGAYVKQPITGLYKWVIDLDLTSMYPSIIMAGNISPETQMGKILNWNSYDYVKNSDITYEYTPFNNSNVLSYCNSELTEFLQSNNYSILSNGVVYRNDVVGIVPEILKIWFDERVAMRKLASKYKSEGNIEMYEYYDNRQWVQKIMLNSVYGALGLPMFRFYDINNAEAVTMTGVDLIKFAETIINNKYNSILGCVDKTDRIIYIDTDSLFTSTYPIIEFRYPDADKNNTEFIVEKTLEIATELQNHVNKSFEYFSKKFLNVSNNIFFAKQEVIADRALWVGKKRYALHAINENGHTVDSMIIKGLDVVRTSFPKAFKIFMQKFLDDILLDKYDKKYFDNNVLGIKNDIKNMPILDIARSTGIKNITKYTDHSKKRKQIFTGKIKGCPVHVKAAINFNDYLLYLDIDKHVKYICNDEKIKYVYLKQNNLNFQELAFRGTDEDPIEVLNMVNNYIDRDKIFEKELLTKLQKIYDALRWGTVPVYSTEDSEEFFDFN